MFCFQNVQQTPSISGWAALQLGQHRFVAASLDLARCPPRRPPHQRMKPPKQLDHRPQQTEPEVASSHVNQLVGEDQFEFRIRLALDYGLRQEHGRAKQPEDRWTDEPFGHYQPHSPAEPQSMPQTRQDPFARRIFDLIRTTKQLCKSRPPPCHQAEHGDHARKPERHEQGRRLRHYKA
jgi:hypothetical protein